MPRTRKRIRPGNTARWRAPISVRTPTSTARCRFPADNDWNTDISHSDVDPNSDNLIASIGVGTGLHPDFGSGTYHGAIIGIPYYVVSDDQPYVKIKLKAYKDESDKGPFPVPPDALIEGYKVNGNKFGGDRHVLVIDRDTNRMYEMYRAFPLQKMAWKCDAGALFHLNSDDVRPDRRSPAGPAPMRQACRSFPALRVMTRPRPARSRTRCGSPSRIRAKPMCRRPITGRRTTRTQICRPWECASA